MLVVIRILDKLKIYFTNNLPTLSSFVSTSISFTIIGSVSASTLVFGNTRITRHIGIRLYLVFPGAISYAGVVCLELGYMPGSHCITPHLTPVTPREKHLTNPVTLGWLTISKKLKSIKLPISWVFQAIVKYNNRKIGSIGLLATDRIPLTLYKGNFKKYKGFFIIM